MRHRLIATIFSFIACFAVYAQDVCVINGKIADDKLANGKAIKKVFLTSADEYGRRTVVAEAKVKKGSYTFKYKVSADAPVMHQDNLSIVKGEYTAGEPAVRYRGIFLNDEAPCLTTWVKNTYGTNYGDHRFYERVFELILRLRGNFMWPAMWSWAFYADDPLNSKVADEMGVETFKHPPCRHPQSARGTVFKGDFRTLCFQACHDPLQPRIIKIEGALFVSL